MAKKKILFITNYPENSAPGQRFRFEQYFPFLESNGFQCTVSPILSLKEARLLYNRGHFIRKFFILLNGFFIRTRDLFRAPGYDLVFIFREAFPAGGPFFERLLKIFSKKIIFDFDDAVWLDNISEANKKFSWIKRPGKISKIISWSDVIFAGNKFLASYALQFNQNVEIIPTTIDTSYHLRKNQPTEKKKICIGWTGSNTTIKHFEFGIPFLKKIKEKFGDQVYFKVISDGIYRNQELEIKGTTWTENTETEELSEMDIGIMPLPDDEWSRGKCGFKALQYMAMEIPAVISPVGVNREIVQDGVNGFLAQNEEEWVEKISLLVDSPELRKKIGENGRRTVQDKYSFESQKEKYLEFFRSLTGKN